MRGPASQNPHRRRPYGAGAARPDGSFYHPAQLFQSPAIQFPVNVQYSHQPPSLSQLVFQNPSIAQPQNIVINNAGFLAERPFFIPPLTLEAVDSVSAQVHKDLVNAGEHVSAWKVSQHTLFALKVDSWSLLRFQPQDIPTLHRLLLTEGKVNSFIHCFVCARIITSLYELKVSLCLNMDAKKFEDLGLGPFLHHPLIKHYFNVPPDLTEVFKINSEEIIHFLQKFIRKLKNVSIEKFLIFVAEQKSVSIKEKLGVRIQDLWFLVRHIRKASKEEETLFSEKLDGSRDHCNKNVVVRKLSSRRHEIAVEKQFLDKRFYDISNSVETFTSKWIDSGNQHAYFPSSDDSNDSKKNDAYDGVEGDEMRKTGTSHCQSITSVKDSGQFVSSCPYPSNSEEMVRLGLKHADNYKSAPTTGHKINEGSANPFKRKLKHKNNKSTNLSSKYLKKGDVVDLEADGQMCDLTLNNGDIEKFVATWRVACHKNSLTEVLDMMLSFYMAELGQRKKIRQFVSCYPVIGLLNVAVSSIKRGGYESIYDTFQSLNEKELLGTDSVGFEEMIDVGPVVEASDPIVAMNCSYRVTHDDIIKKITNYVEIYEMTPKQSLPLVKPLTALKKLYDCETWLMDQFKVKEFCSLGHGRFSDFLENHISMLPLQLHSLLSKEFLQESSVEFCLNQQQLGVMLSQAVGNNVVKADTASLLKKQFNAASFHLIGVDSQNDFVELINSHKEISKSSCILYSACLLGGLWNGNHLVCNENSFLDTGEMVNEIALEHVVRRTSKDAVECLLKAPMLSDILYWSHWDVLYAPSLGPLPEFLLNKVNFKNLLCIVTVDGKYIRIDHTATVDEFLESLVQCSPFHIALKFLSLLGLYGGACNAPVALLKCYAQKAMDVIIQNSADSVEDNVFGQNSLVGQSLSTFSCGRSVNSDGIKKCNTDFDQSTLCKVNDAIPTISRIVLKFFQYLPSEFRNLAAEIFLPGLGFYTKLAPTVLLNQCRETMERVMLHDIGLSLGIAEWVIDHHQFSSSTVFDLSVPPKHAEQAQSSYYLTSSLDCSNSVQVLKVFASGNQKITHGKISDGLVLDGNQKINPPVVNLGISLTEFVDIDQRQGLGQATSMGTKFSDKQALHDATVFVESIRFEEFGLSPHSSKCEDRLLKKQHARLGRALQCLSQELYSQDSHFILELVQNADDNMYPNNVEPELVFILQETGIVVLNNEFGFSAENIRALCDVGNSTKKGSGGGYIGKKGIGFKSVFRVTDAPEIHSNGFHVKFDITEGQIGFVLPTVVPPCAADTFKQYLYGDDYQGNDDTSWNTCILLPFRSQKNDGTGVSSIISMFSDLHPSLLLFLHRLKCIKFRNSLSDRFIVMRKETLHDGIVKISHGEEVLSWLVISKKLRSSFIRTDVDATEISMAFTLQETDYGEYKPILRNQPVFSFLPLRNYGLKFILQGDFVLPSSREEVIGDSAWNQWLLSEFPSLFFIAEKSFCALPCFVENPGKAVTIYMSFVPLPGEVHGFFSRLPQMIISFLRRSSCLLQDSPDLNWVLPCRVLRGWNEQVRLLLSDFLLQRQLGLVYLHKDILLSDSLAMALGIQNYGPKILVEVIESVCHSTEYLKSLGIEWLSAWFCTVYSSLSKQGSLSAELEYDITYCLKHIPLIPLSDGSFGRVSDGPIWLPCDVLNKGPKTEYHPKDFPCLYNNLKIVTPQLFFVSTKNSFIIGDVIANNIMQMLIKIGVQQMSSHEVLRSHILVALSNKKSSEDRNLMIEYLTFIMLHLQSDCASCHFERHDIITTLQKLPLLLTNHGFKSSFHESIHFGREYGNPVDVVTLFDSVDIKWIEVDSSYLKHPASLPLSSGLVQWRAFFIDLGVTDFVRVIATEKSVEDFLSEGTINISSFKPATSFVKDWESPELVNMLSIFSSKNLRTKCIYLLEVFDKMWDDCYSFQAKSFFIPKTGGTQKPFVSSFMKCIHKFAWIASTMDQDLHQPNNLFYDCEQIRSVLGTISPYAVPKVNNKVFANDLGFKMEVSLNDALEILQLWKKSQSLFVASIAQMLKFYILISNGISASSSKIIEDLKSSCFIFVPLLGSCQNIASVSGIFLSPMEVYWEDPTGCVDRMKELWLLHKDKHILCKSLQTVYPTLHDFFVNVCGVPHTPSFSSYFQILQQLSSIALPSEAAHKVFQVMVRWADKLNSGLVSTDQMSELKKNFMKLENTVLPTEQDKWVSLHPSFGLICWSDDYILKKQFKHSDGVDFIQFGELSVEELSMLSGSVATFLHSIGVPSLSKIVLREAIFYGVEENRGKVSLVNRVISYAQRYIHNLHLDIYLKLKQLGFEKLGQLQIVVVRQLFYKNILPDHHCASRQRFECNCLLQGNTLYATQTADAHSIFLELSRFFFNGSTDLHFANFLHMVIIMAQSGSTVEQTEYFVVNSQKIPKLPDDEPSWSIASTCEADMPSTSQPVSMPSADHLHHEFSKPSGMKQCMNSDWPPPDWKTAPGFERPRFGNMRKLPSNNCCLLVDPTEKTAKDVALVEDRASDENAIEIEDPVSVEITGDWAAEEDSMASGASAAMHSEPPVPPKLIEKIDLQIPDEHILCRATGRFGELIAFRFLAEKYGPAHVKWVNEEAETGLPYDLEVGGNEDRQYIEVKSTKSLSKRWFDISVREWKFAAEKGDSYSIAHVSILGQHKARVTLLKNPYQLVRQKFLGLALSMPRY